MVKYGKLSGELVCTCHGRVVNKLSYAENICGFQNAYRRGLITNVCTYVLCVFVLK